MDMGWTDRNSTQNTTHGFCVKGQVHMDANELATIAFEAMPMSVLTPIDQGQVYGVLAMALQTLEMQYGALPTEADEETAEAKKLWREALAELDALKVDRDAVLAANHALNVDLRNRTADLNAAIIARDASGADYAALAASFATMRQDRDKLSQQCDLMAAELDAKQRELDEVRSQLAERRDATNHLAACVTGRDMAMSKLWRIVDDKADAYTSQEIYRAFRKWEASLRAMPPGADTVAKTEELHGMAKVHLVPAGSEDL